ncbi:hypothetical protein QZH41_002101 [Actinostola sp. cb2023]|nr:hypothetical protein QZH41_002101 [Actinostola sp. cb2023]
MEGGLLLDDCPLMEGGHLQDHCPLMEGGLLLDDCPLMEGGHLQDDCPLMEGDGEKITVEEGLISQKFNINESLPENINKNEHPHLADIVIPIVDIPRVSVVIGKDVDEAHEVLETEEHWPETSFQEIPVEQLEVKKEIYATKLEPASAIDELINRSSSWIGTLRKVAWLLKFVDWIKNRSLQKNVEKAPEVQKMICQDDIERAKKRVAAIVQRKTYPDEVKYLSEGKRVKASSEIVRLKPVMKGDRVVRVGGRISMAPISEDAMNPMILPKEHHITTIVIRHIHQRNGHCGVEQTLCILREQFWVVKARVAIKKVLGKCIQCRKRMAPKAQQEMASLPKIRLTPYEPSFTYAGVDYFGPLWVKRGRGRVMEKRWGAIFVCMNTRAVHLEVAKSLETDDFILVLMRFLNRRGHVKELRSDNGTNFVGAEREITESIKKMDHDKLGRELIKRGCNWVFHPPGASHMSGVWERLVRTVKRSLKAILGNSPMNDEVLSTVFTEAERIANSRLASDKKPFVTKR